MTDVSGATAVDAAPASLDLPADAPESFSSVNEAAAYFAELQEKRKQPAESADTATAEHELPDEGNAAPAEEQATGETQEDDPAEVPPLDLPRSWTKEQAEHWNALPRVTQEYLAAQDSKASAEVRRVQNEAAEARKAAQAEREHAEKARQQYEANLPALMNELESVNQAQFGDIKSMEDVVKLQAEDPFRFQSWQVHQMRLQAAKQESDRVASLKSQEQLANRVKYDAEQTSLLKELVPEFSDEKKFAEAKERAIKMLTGDLGLKNEQLSRWFATDVGHEILSSAGIQKLMVDGLKYRDLQAAPRAVAAKPLPPVQKPGTARSSGNALNEQIQALSKELDRTGDLKTAQKLYALQSRRAS